MINWHNYACVECFAVYNALNPAPTGERCIYPSLNGRGREPLRRRVSEGGWEGGGKKQGLRTLCGSGIVLFLILFLALPAIAGKDFSVVTSIRPVHSLAAAVMEGAGQPELLIDEAQSPHGYQLRPLQMKILNSADIVFYVDEYFETFLGNALKALPRKVKKVALSETRGLKIYDLRGEGPWEKPEYHQQGNSDEHHAIGKDYHLWLDPDNAALLAGKMAGELSRIDPVNSNIYRSNALEIKNKIKNLDRTIIKKLGPVSGKPYIVFHDAYQYFEKHYGLNGAGSITVDPHLPPPVRSLMMLRDRIKSSEVKCVFYEPQFKARLVDTVIEGTAAKAARLDPLGTHIEKGPDLYIKMMRDIAEKMADCLE
jgi:zinc transport system substrate-binding protein